MVSHMDLVRFFHSMLHVDASFQLVDAVFNPYNTRYLESLVGIAVPFVAVGAIILLAFLMFALYRACRMCCGPKPVERPRPYAVLVWLTGLALLIGLCSSVWAVYYNEALHTAEQGIVSPATTIDAFAANATQLLNALAQNATGSYATVMTGLVPNARAMPPAQQAAVATLQTTTGNMSAVAGSARNTVAPLSAQPYSGLLSTYANVQHAVTLAALLVCGFVLVLGAVAMLVRRRTLVALVATLVLLALVIAWCLCGGAVALSMAASDYCFNTTATEQAVLAAQSPELRNVLRYYVLAQGSGPFAGDHDAVSSALTSAFGALSNLDDYANRTQNATLQRTLTTLRGQLNTVSATNNALVPYMLPTTTNGAYRQAQSQVCNSAIVALASATLGVLVYGVFVLIGLCLLLALPTVRRASRPVAPERQPLLAMSSAQTPYETPGAKVTLAPDPDGVASAGGAASAQNGAADSMAAVVAAAFVAAAAAAAAAAASSREDGGSNQSGTDWPSLLRREHEPVRYLGDASNPFTAALSGEYVQLYPVSSPTQAGHPAPGNVAGADGGGDGRGGDSSSSSSDDSSVRGGGDDDASSAAPADQNPLLLDGVASQAQGPIEPDNSTAV